MGPGGMMQLGRIRCLWRLWYVMQMALHLASPASGSGLPVLEVHQAERDNCILAVSF